MKKIRKILSWALLFLWMGVIFYLSNQPDLKSGFESSIDFVLRKLAHITEYAVLTFLVWRTLIVHHDIKDPRFLFIAVIFSVLYAISDEYHQSFIGGRSGNSLDVMIDGIGIAIMAALIRREELRGNFK